MNFSNFGDFLYYAYANLQMLHYCISNGLEKYDRTCYMIRAKAYKAYKEGRWHIHDLLNENVSKIQQNDVCWYCGKAMSPKQLTKDHVFPRSKGGDNNMDNIIMTCKACNSSKGNMDLFKWYAEVRKEWPPLNVIVHYMKNIYLYCADNDLFDKSFDELNNMDLPFDWRYIPQKYPQPAAFLHAATEMPQVQ